MTAPPLKILHTHFGTDGGAERFFVNLVTAFAQRKIEQRFIMRPNRNWGDKIEALGPVIEHPYRRISISSLFLQARVKRLLKQWQPDVIMAWMHRAARLMPHYEGALKVVRLGDFPRKLDHLKNCDIIVGNLPGICQRAEDLGWPKQLKVISNFPRQIQAVPVNRSDMHTPDDAFVVSAAGRLMGRKGFDTLLKAITKVPQAYLWLMGDGEKLDELQQQAAALGIDERVRFTGWVDEPMHYVSASNLFVLSSRHEPLGNVILEAWQLGIPVLATRSEGPSWFMTHEEDGYLVDIGDVDAMAQGIIRLRDNPELVRKLVTGGHKTNTKMFFKDSIVDQYIDLFETGSSRIGAN